MLSLCDHCIVYYLLLLLKEYQTLIGAIFSFGAIIFVWLRQSKLNRRQLAENTVFKLIDFQYKILSGMQVEGKKKENKEENIKKEDKEENIKKGKEVFNVLVGVFNEFYLNEKIKNENEGKGEFGKSFKQLIEKYGLLSALNINNPLFQERKSDYNNFYKESAFGENGFFIRNLS